MTGWADFTMTEADYVSANRAWFVRAFRTRKLLVRIGLAMVGLALLGSWLFSDQSTRTRLIVAGAAASYVPLFVGAIYLLSFLLLPRRARRLYRQSRIFAQPRRVRWDEEAITYETTNGVGRYPYADLHRWQDARGAVLLYLNDQLFLLVPHHALAPEQLTELRDLLTHHGPPKR